MSERLPVGETLNEAFQFALKRWGTIIRLGWLPIFVIMLIASGMIVALIDIEAIQAASDDPGIIFRPEEYLKMSLSLTVAAAVGAGILMTIVVSGFTASVYRLVALGEEQPGFFNLRIDGPAMRVFWSQIILSVINYVIIGAAFLGAAAATGHAPGEVVAAFGNLINLAAAAEQSGVPLEPEQLKGIMGPISVVSLAGLISIIPLIYINMKLVPFPPGSAAENRLLLMGSFSLTKGHFWSILGILFLLGLLMMLMNMIFGLTSEILEQIIQLGMGQGGAFAIVGAVSGVILFVATVLFQAFILGLQLSIRAIIYRRLKTGV